MDIQGAAIAGEAAGVAPANAGSFESAAAERREVEESTEASREPERSATDEGVGDRVDLEA